MEMKHPISLFVAAIVAAYPVAVAAPPIPYSNFSKLPDLQKSKIISGLQQRNQWGKPDQKPIIADILATQARYDSNRIAYTTSAIDIVDAQGWKDLTPLVQHIYEHPQNVWVYVRSFEYLQKQAGHPVPAELITAAETFKKAGQYENDVTDEQLQAATDEFMRQTNKEAVMVYAIDVAGWHAGKGGKSRGRLAAVQVLNTLERDAVVARVKQLYTDADEPAKGEFEWLADQLQINIEGATSQPGKRSHRLNR